jgi:hypothetical protein
MGTMTRENEHLPIGRAMRGAAVLLAIGLIAAGTAEALDSDPKPRFRFQIGHKQYEGNEFSFGWTQLVTDSSSGLESCLTGSAGGTGPFYYPTLAVPKKRVKVAFNMRRAQRPARIVIRDRRATSAKRGYGRARVLRKRLRPLRHDGRIFAWRAIVTVRKRGAHLLVARVRWPLKGPCGNGGKRYINASFSFFLGPRF